ncbi:MAG: hypothetical protein JWO67_5622 [Streptosporangiaceae bacterium]|nr:hypothetical protein [Streptosporangiaceae bacterium]
MTALVDHTSELDRALAMVLPHHDAEGVHFAGSENAHTADAWIGKTHFEATAPTCVQALAAAITGLHAAIGGAA